MKYRGGNMVTYFFSGRVIPERAAVTVSPSKFRASVREAALDFEAEISIGVSQVSVVVQTAKEVKDLPTLRNYVEQLVRTEVDAFGYLEGRGYDVEITSVTSADGQPLVVFGVEIRELQESKSERPVSFEELWKLLWDAKAAPLRRALGDLREAIRAPLDTGFFCYRAVESLRQGFVEPEDGDSKGASWERLRNALCIDRSWIDELQKFGNPQRHGATPYMSGEERLLAMRLAWKVVDRLVEYVKRDFQPLSQREFCLLKLV